jgi:regulator of RNase E activity RraB
VIAGVLTIILWLSLELVGYWLIVPDKPAFQIPYLLLSTLALIVAISVLEKRWLARGERAGAETVLMTETEILENTAGHRARNAELLRALRDRGLSLDQPRAVEHHFWADKQEDAALLAKELYKKGYLILSISPTDLGDGPKSWNVEAGVQQSPEIAASPELGAELVRLAAGLGCVYDGWGTSV